MARVSRSPLPSMSPLQQSSTTPCHKLLSLLIKKHFVDTLFGSLNTVFFNLERGNITSEGLCLCTHLLNLLHGRRVFHHSSQRPCGGM